MGECVESGPLSHQQEEMLATLAGHPQSARQFDLPLLYRLDGELDAERLLGALCELALRHGALRTTLEQDGDRVRQRVAAEPVLRTAATRGSDATAATARRLVGARLETADVLSGRPLFAAELVRRDATHHLLALAMHHLVHDGLSLPVMWRDLAELYAARLHDRAPHLPAPGPTYVHYARSQRASWPAIAPAALRHWRAVLDGAPLPATLPRPAVTGGSHATATVTVALTPRTWQHVAEAARRARATAFLVLLSATAIALAEVADEGEVVVGTEFSNRESAHEADMVGLLSNTRLIRVAARPRRTLREHVRAVREAWLTADEHRAAHISRVLDALGCSAGRASFVAVSLELDDAVYDLRLPGVEVTRVPLEVEPLYWRDIRVTWRPGRDACEADIEFRPSRVDGEAVRAVAAALRRALVQLSR